MSPIVSGAIMAHPARREPAQLLSRVLDGTPVVFDPHPGGSNSLITARSAWASRTEDSTHHFVVQDDVLATPALLTEMNYAAAAFPDAAIAFYANWDSFTGAMARLALMAGCGWVEFVRWEYFPTLATMLPARYADAYVAFAEEVSKVHFEDDEVLFDFIRMHNIESYVSVPALVEHGAMESLAGNPVRKAAVYADGMSPEPVRRNRVAHSITMCPFFWRGTPYTFIRSGELNDHAWRYVHWHASAPRLGLDVDALRGKFDAEFGFTRSHNEAEQEFLFSLWAMSLLLGLLPRTSHVEVTGPEAAPELDQTTIDRALRTFVPAALMKSAFPPDAFDRAVSLEIARHGYVVGLHVPELW